MAKRTQSRVSYEANVNFKTDFEGRNLVHPGAILGGEKVKFGTFVGRDSHLPNACIGRCCSIARSVEIITHSHPNFGFVSTHPAFYSLLKQSGFTYVNKQRFKKTLNVSENNQCSVLIGSDVWIGARALIMGA